MPWKQWITKIVGAIPAAVDAVKEIRRARSDVDSSSLDALRSKPKLKTALEEAEAERRKQKREN